MGPCVAGGAYLPVMCDKYIIVEGASMFLAGPALVKAAIGQEIDQDTLGGANTHSAISGIADYNEKDDISGIDRIRTILKNINLPKSNLFPNTDYEVPLFKSSDLNYLFNPNQHAVYDMKEIISRIVDGSVFSEFKKTMEQLFVEMHRFLVIKLELLLTKN